MDILLAFPVLLFSIGALSVNEIRGYEDLDPVEGGDRHFVPLNLVPLEEAGEREADGAEALKAALREAQGSAATHRRFAIKSR